MWIAALPLVLAPDLTPWRPAPAHGLETWHGAEADESGVVRRSSDQANPDGRALAELGGWVVVLHRVDQDRERLQLVADLLRCNADRRVTALAHTRPEQASFAKDMLADHGLTHPLGLVEDEACPYAQTPLAVVGRAGELVWAGDPGRDEDELLEALAVALDTIAAPPLEGAFTDATDDAREHYYQGRWDKARKAADKAERKAPEEARVLQVALAQHERDLLARVPELSGSLRHIELALLERALARGWPRSAVAEACAERAKEEKKVLGAGTFLDAQTWAELQDTRPVLFPARKDSAGKKWAKKLGVLVRNANDTGLTRTVRAMLAEFEAR